MVISDTGLSFGLMDGMKILLGGREDDVGDVEIGDIRG